MRADRSTKLLMIVLSSMFLQQAFATLGRSLPPIIAPVILTDLGLDPAWLGIYVGAAALSAVVVASGLLYQVVGTSVVMIVVAVLMAAVLVMHMCLLGRLLPVRMGVVLGRCSGCRGFARGCQSLFMQPLAACSVKG